jgi:hypothetical protein
VKKPGGSSVGRDIRAIRTSLSSIARAVQRLAPLLQAAAAAGPGNPSRRGRRLRISAERRAALQLQGQYMGHLRSLKPRQKTRVKALRAAKGVRAAIAFARRLAKR